jgi:ribosomal protein S18 acetylase RimI-like enzyme
MAIDPLETAPLDPGQARACEAAELAAVESWMRAIPASVAQEFGIGCERLGEALLVHGRVDVLMFNRVLGLGALETDIERTLSAALERFAVRGGPRFMIQIAPGPWYDDVTTLAGAHGFYDHNYWIRLLRGAAAPPAVRTDLSLEPLRPHDAKGFGAIAAAAFNHPPAFADWNAALATREGWQFFGAYEGDVLAGGAALFLHGDTGYFGFAVTRSEFRGRGAQSALIARRIEASLAAGCRRIVVETAADTPAKPNPSTRNLRRLGFVDLYWRRNWVKVLASEATSQTPSGV